MTFSLSTSDGKSGPQRWRLDLHHLYFLLAALQVLAVGGMIWFGNEAMNSEQATAKLAESWGNCTTEVIHMAELAAAANAPGNDVFESHDISREKLRLDKALVAFRDLMQSVTNRLADDTRVAETPIFEFRLGQIEKRISGIETYGKRVFAALADGDDESAGANMAEMDQQFAAVLPEVTRLCQELREDQQRALTAHMTYVGSLKQIQVFLMTASLMLLAASGWYGFKLTRGVDRANQSRAHFSAIVESSDDAIIGVSLDGQITAWNHGAERLFGYSSREILGRPSLTLIPRDRLHEKDFVLDKSESRLHTRHYDTVRRRKDGSLVDVSLTISPIYSPGGEVVGVSKIVRDITQRKLAEQQLLDSEARTKAVLDTAADAIITIDERGRIQSFNPAAERLFGYARAEILGQNIAMLMPSPYQEEHDGYLQHYLETGEKKIIGIGREAFGLRKDGEQFPLELAVSEVQQGDVRMFTGIVRDITERKRLEDEREKYTAMVEQSWAKMELQAMTLETQTHELEKAREDAVQASKAKSEFLANMSHELRTPMNSIIGFTQRLLKKIGGTLEPQHLDALQTIDRNSRHLLGLINDVLDLSKIEAGRMDLKRSEFDLVQAVREVAGQTSSLTDTELLPAGSR